MTRIAVVGVTGSGKTTLAQLLSQELSLPHIELDALHWGANWTSILTAELRPRVQAALVAVDWVVDGNYGNLRDVIWAFADTLIWLDFPMPLIVWRLLRRTLRRIMTHENMWNANCYESWRTQFFSRESLFLYAPKSQRKHRNLYPTLFTRPEYAHLQVIRLYSPRAVDRWIWNIRDETYAE